MSRNETKKLQVVKNKARNSEDGKSGKSEINIVDEMQLFIGNKRWLYKEINRKG